jgi:hypothetical protein
VANPITVTSALAYTNPTYNIAQKLLQIGGTSNQQTFPIVGKNYKQSSVLVPTNPTAIDVSGLSNVGWAAIKNNDPANPILLMTGVAGAIFGRVMAGEMALLRLDSSVTAPAWVAQNAPVETEALLIEY